MKAPPPFPVVAPPKVGPPPVPHVNVAAEVPGAQAGVEVAKIPLFKKKVVQISALAAIILIGAGIFAWKKFMTPPPAPPVVAKPKPAAATAAKATTPAAAPTSPAVAPAPATTGLATPSDTLNNLAHAPVNAVNKAKGAVAARDASGQSRVEPVVGGDDLANKPAATDAVKQPSRPATSVTSLGPGLSASAGGDAGAEVTPAYKAFISNAKINSVIGGNSPKATINGRVIRPGEMVDGTLGIVLEGVDVEARQLIFKDKAGAVVARRY